MTIKKRGKHGRWQPRKKPVVPVDDLTTLGTYDPRFAAPTAWISIVHSPTRNFGLSVSLIKWALVLYKDIRWHGFHSLLSTLNPAWYLVVYSVRRFHG
jgi:hypothetical protein